MQGKRIWHDLQLVNGHFLLFPFLASGDVLASQVVR